MRVKKNKTKVIISEEQQKVTQKAVRWPRGVCGKGISNNSVQCTGCQKWVHRKCSGIKGNMYKVMTPLTGSNGPSYGVSRYVSVCHGISRCVSVCLGKYTYLRLACKVRVSDHVGELQSSHNIQFLV